MVVANYCVFICATHWSRYVAVIYFINFIILSTHDSIMYLAEQIVGDVMY